MKKFLQTKKSEFSVLSEREMKSLNGGEYRLGKCHCECWDIGQIGEWDTDDCDLNNLNHPFISEYCGGTGMAICQLNRKQ